MFARMVDTRRALHRRPELAFAEHETTRLIRERLDELGLLPRPGAGTTGAVAMLLGGRPGRTVLLRADIDGLPITEGTGLEFSSELAGAMHACGHDAHTAGLLGAAEAMASRAVELPGRYLFVFQPAEEQMSGAREMLDAGLLEESPVDVAVGWHVTTALPVGVVKIREGLAMSDAQGLRITFRGSGGHAARGGPNVLVSAATVLTSLESVVAGLEYEGAASVCSAGVVRGGTAMNVVPTEAVIEGSLRTFTGEQKEEALDRLSRLVAEAAATAGAEGGVELTLHAPAVRNDQVVTGAVAETARRLLGSDRVISGPPITPSDDVSEILSRVPGCYFHVGGQRADGGSGDHHSPRFDIDEESMRTGAIIMAEAAVTLAMSASPARPMDAISP
ncbi:MAG: M20 metallopeptidase family protein [Acidimicrobiales bacterium]